MLKINDICFSYHRRPVLKGLTLQAGAGECLAIVGPNGCGKSTALAIMAGVLRPDSGTVTAPERIGYVPQKGGLIEDMTVLDNLRFFARLSGGVLPPVQPLGIDSYLKQRVSRLSGGMKKRVSIACALAAQPQLLLLDEPCEALDAQGRDELGGLLQYLMGLGMCVVYVGHDGGEFAPFFTHLACIKDGSARVYSRHELLGDAPEGEMTPRLQQRLGQMFNEM